MIHFRGENSWGGAAAWGRGWGQGARAGKEQDKAEAVNSICSKHFFKLDFFKIGLLEQGIVQNWIKALS